MKANIHVTRIERQPEADYPLAKKQVELIASHVYSMHFKRLSYMISHCAQTLIIQPARARKKIHFSKHAAERLLNRY